MSARKRYEPRPPPPSLPRASCSRRMIHSPRRPPTPGHCRSRRTIALKTCHQLRRGMAPDDHTMLVASASRANGQDCAKRTDARHTLDTTARPSRCRHLRVGPRREAASLHTWSGEGGAGRSSPAGRTSCPRSAIRARERRHCGATARRSAGRRRWRGREVCPS